VKLVKMKKLMCMAAMLLMIATAAFGENENISMTANTADYEMHTNAKSLVRYLGTSEDQTATVIDFQRGFENALQVASVMNEDTRKSIIDNAISGNLKNMKYVLTNEQYQKYLRVLYASLKNRNIVK